MRRTIYVTTALVLALAGSARAQVDTMSASLTPSAAAVGSTLHVAVSGAAPELAGALPESLTLDLQRGFALDLAAVAGRCDASHAPIGDCPAASRIGGGAALARTSGLLNEEILATIDIFLADRMQPGDLASVVLRLSVGSQSRGVRARLLALPSGPFGYELRATGFAAAIPTFPGVLFELRGLTLDIGARRKVTRTVIKRMRVTRKGKRVTIRRKVKRTVRHDLIRNPATCPGAWAARVTVRVAGSDRPRDLAMACTTS